MVVPHLESIIVKHILGSRFPKVGDYLYTHPPRREWRWLSEEEIDRLADAADDSDIDDTAIIKFFARLVEAKLKELNP